MNCERNKEAISSFNPQSHTTRLCGKIKTTTAKQPNVSVLRGWAMLMINKMTESTYRLLINEPTIKIKPRVVRHFDGVIKPASAKTAHV